MTSVTKTTKNKIMSLGGNRRVFLYPDDRYETLWDNNICLASPGGIRMGQVDYCPERRAKFISWKESHLRRGPQLPEAGRGAGEPHAHLSQRGPAWT